MTYEYDEEMKTLEMLQMPELSSGRYVHDFFKKKTLIVDSDNSRCFITALDEEQIREPTSMCQILKDIHDEILDEILDNDSDEIRLVRKKRSIEDTSKEFNFVEFTGKSLLKYDIVNVDL